MPQKALIYCRVSTKRQNQEGSGLSSQKKRCELYALQHGYEIDGIFPDDVTGSGNFMEREGMVNMLDHIKANRKTRYVVIFDDLKRLSRDTKYYLILRETLDALKVRVECLNFTFDDTPEGEFYETVIAAGGQLERKQQARQVKQKVSARFEAGYWGLRAPVGYTMQKEKGQPRILIRDEPIATYIQNALEAFASGHFQSQMEVKRYLESCPEFPKTYRQGREVHPDRVKKMLTRSVYAGMVELPCRGISMRKGHHEGLISLDTFYKIQERLNGKKKIAPTRKDLNSDFILRGAVNCSDCNTPYTANWSKGRNTRYPYYICRTKGCKSHGKSIQRDKLENEFESLLRTLTPQKDLALAAKLMLRDLWDDLHNDKEKRQQTFKSQIVELETEQENIIKRLMSTHIASVIQAYEQRIEKIELEKAVLHEKISNCGRKVGSFDESFRTALEFLSNPYHMWASERIEYKRAVIKLAFSDSLVFDRKSGFRTAPISMPFRVLEALDNHDSLMAETEGFEPSMRL